MPNGDGLQPKSDGLKRLKSVCSNASLQNCLLCSTRVCQCNSHTLHVCHVCLHSPPKPPQLIGSLMAVPWSVWDWCRYYPSWYQCGVVGPISVVARIESKNEWSNAGASQLHCWINHDTHVQTVKPKPRNFLVGLLQGTDWRLPLHIAPLSNFELE